MSSSLGPWIAGRAGKMRVEWNALDLYSHPRKINGCLDADSLYISGNAWYHIGASARYDKIVVCNTSWSTGSKMSRIRSHLRALPILSLIQALLASLASVLGLSIWFWLLIDINPVRLQGFIRCYKSSHWPLGWTMEQSFCAQYLENMCVPIAIQRHGHKNARYTSFFIQYWFFFIQWAQEMTWNH